MDVDVLSERISPSQNSLVSHLVIKKEEMMTLTISTTTTLAVVALVAAAAVKAATATMKPAAISCKTQILKFLAKMV